MFLLLSKSTLLILRHRVSHGQGIGLFSKLLNKCKGYQKDDNAETMLEDKEPKR